MYIYIYREKTTPNNSFALQCYCNNASHEWFSPLFSLHSSCNMVMFTGIYNSYHYSHLSWQ